MTNDKFTCKQLNWYKTYFELRWGFIQFLITWPDINEAGRYKKEPLLSTPLDEFRTRTHPISVWILNKFINID